MVSGETTVEHVMQFADSPYYFNERHEQKRSEYFYDTFDWRVFKNNYFLHRRGNTFSLNTVDDSSILKESGFSRKTFFPEELVDGRLREILQSVADIRALIQIFLLKTTRRKFDLCNKDRKTVLRLHIDESVVIGNGMEKELPQIIYLEEVRGYNKAFAKVSKRLAETGLEKLDGGYAHFHLALSKIDKRPLDYSSRFAITMERGITVQQTVSSICIHLAEAMKKNLAGIIEDVDSEFLHDFRIAIRRTRSLLSQMKKFLPFEKYSYFQNEFKWLGAITGPVRDIDVYLLKKQQYQSMLPAQLHQGLSDFFVDLEHHRKKKFTVMKKGLTLDRYQKLMGDWEAFLTNEPDGFEWSMKDNPCYPLAVKMIQKRFRRLLKDGGMITDKSPDEDLHRLRIQGKKSS